MIVNIEKIPGGFRLDNLDLKNGKCGCTSLLPCCYSWSKLKRKGNMFLFHAKITSPETKENFNWGYKVKKGDILVEVTVEDARDKTIFSGYYPPEIEEFLENGWELLSKEGKREDFGLWRCATCKWLYKEKKEGVEFEKLPDDWRCPVCKAGKNVFEKIG